MTITRLSTSAYTIPTDYPEADGTLSWDETTMVVVEVSDGDHEGIGWTYAGAGAVRLIEDHLASVVVGSEGADLPRHGGGHGPRRAEPGETGSGGLRHLGRRHRACGI